MFLPANIMIFSFSGYGVARPVFPASILDPIFALPVVSITEDINTHLVIGKIEDKNRHLAVSPIGVRIGEA